MKVMYLIWSLEHGGAEKMVGSLATFHDSAVVPLVCCLDNEGYFAEALRKEGIKVMALHKRRGFDPSILPRLRDIIRQEGVDIINSHLWTANLYARLLRFICEVPVIAVEHSMDIWKKWYHFKLDRLLCCKADSYVFVSEAVRDFYADRVPATTGRHVVVHNGIDLAPFRTPGHSREEILQHFGARENAILLVNVGRLVAAKNQAELVRITRTLVDCGCDVYTVIAGDGPMRGVIEKVILETGMSCRVWLAGVRDDVPSLLKGCDIFVMTSTREGLPLAILETMAAGTPPVYYDVGGISEVVNDGLDGVRIPPGDVSVMVSVLQRLISSPRKRLSLAEAGKSRGLANFDIQTMVRAYEGHFHNILGRQ